MIQAGAGSISARRRGESPGLWLLVWRRFCRDPVGLAACAVVVFFCGLMAASGLSLIASDWSTEAGINYAPPTFIGAQIPEPHPGATSPVAAGAPRGEGKDASGIVDPLADVLSAIRRDKPAGAQDSDIVDPLADVLAEIRQQSGGAAAQRVMAPRSYSAATSGAATC